MTFVDSLGAGLNVVSVSDLALPVAPIQPDSKANTTEEALISLLMTLSDTQETTLSGAQKSELGLLGITQMLASIGVIIYVYLVYGVRLNLKKGGILNTLQAR